MILKRFLFLVGLLIALSSCLNAQRIDGRQIKRGDYIRVTSPISATTDDLGDVLTDIYSASTWLKDELDAGNDVYIETPALTDSLVIRNPAFYGSLGVEAFMTSRYIGIGSDQYTVRMEYNRIQVIDQLGPTGDYVLIGADHIEVNDNDSNTELYPDRLETTDGSDGGYGILQGDNLYVQNGVNSANFGPLVVAAADLTDFTVGSYTFDVTGAAGAGQDGYILTYDHGGGLIGLAAPLQSIAYDLENVGPVSLNTALNNLQFVGTNGTATLRGDWLNIQNPLNTENTEMGYNYFTVVNSISGDIFYASVTNLSADALTTCVLGNYDFDITQSIAGLTGAVLTLQSGGDISLDTSATVPKLADFTVYSADPSATITPDPLDIVHFDIGSAGWTQVFDPAGMEDGSYFYIEIIDASANTFTFDSSTGSVIRSANGLTYTPAATQGITGSARFFIMAVWDGTNFRLYDYN